MSGSILKILTNRKKDKVKSFAVLIDPDQLQETKDCLELIELGKENKIDFISL